MDKFDATVRRARVFGPIAAFALVASALVVPNLAQTPAAYAKDAPAADVTLADDFTSARVDAKAQGHRVEVLSDRTETTQTFVSAKGVVTREIAAAPVRVRDSSADGWGPIDLRLAKQSDGSYAPSAVPGDVRISGGEDADAEGSLVSLGAGKRTITLDWTGGLPQPTIDGATATYADVKPGMDLKVEVTRTGIEQYFVLRDRPTEGEEPTLALPLSASGVVVADGKRDAGQTIETKSGDAVGAISPALTWDASTEGGIHTQTDVSTSEVKTVDGKQSLVITPDAAFLQSPDTTYPVTIDPSVTLSGSSVTDSYIKTSAPDTNFPTSTQLYVGSNDGGATKYRSFVTVATGAAMKGATVSSASLGLWESNASSCTASYVSAYGYPTRHYAVNQTWNNQSDVDMNQVSTVTTAKGFSSSCAAGWVNFDVAKQLQYSLNAPYEVMTVVLGAEESNNTGWKAFDSAEGTHVPTLTVTYDLPPAKSLIPAVSAGTTGATKVYTSSLSPSFSTTSADPETENVKYTYNLYNAATPQDATTLVGTCTTSYVPSGSPASCAPNVTLTDGTSYWTRAIATDASGVSGKSSSSLYFATAAAKPTTPTISCPSPYTDGSWATAAPTTSVTCSVSVVGNYKGLGPKNILITLDGADPTTTAVADSGTTTATIAVPKSAGVHTLTANTTSGAQLSSTTATYRFGYGSPGLATPNDGLKTLGPVKISAYGPFRGVALSVSAKLQWRVSGASSSSSGWNTASTTDVTPSSASASPFLSTTWDSATATSDASVSPAMALNSRQNTLLDVRVCFTYDAGAPQCTTDAGTITSLLRVPSAFSDGFPTAVAGEGTVALATGEFSEDETDVDISTTLGALSIDRTHSTFATSVSSGAATGVFGPGWSADFGIDTADSGDLIVDDQTVANGTINFGDSSGTTLSYTTPNALASATPSGTYIPVDRGTREANETVAVSGSGSNKSLTMTDLDGTITTWKQSTSGAITSWVPVSIAEAGQQGATTYTTDGSGHVTRILAPVPDGVTCPTSGSMPPGCSWLRLSYAASTTAVAGTPGDYFGQLKSVYYNTFDPSTSAMSEIKVAGYTYDTGGRLSVETNSLNALTKSYTYATYNGLTALTQASASGAAPYKYSYDSVGGNVRLSSVTRGAPTSGGSDVVLSSYAYAVTPGTAGPDLSSSQIAKWGQTTAPTTAYAVFGIDHPVVGTPSASDWPYATLYYTDSAGHTINTAAYGAGEWLVGATNYTAEGEVDTSLSPIDVHNAIATSASGSPFDAKANAAVIRYLPPVAGSNPDVQLVAPGSIPSDMWSAPFSAVLQDGTTQQVRTHTHYTYDEGAPAGDINPATGAPYLLPTTVSVGVSGVSDTSTDPTGTLPDNLETNSVTKYNYNPIDGASATGPTSGWVLGQATMTSTVVPNGADIVRKVRYDAIGNAVAVSEPGSSGTDAGTSLVVAYTVGGNSQDASCGSHPEWAGLTCWSGPAAPPESGPDIPDSRVTYNRWLEPLSVSETSGVGSTVSTRTTTNTYFTDGRLNTRSLSTTGLPGSTALLKTKIAYSSGTLTQTGTQSLNSDASVASQDVATLDLWGRTTKYLSNSVDNSNYSYIAPGSPGAGLIASVATPKGTSTYTYDGTDANGNVEHRGLPTGLSVTGVGSFAAGYDRGGNLTKQTMPAGITRYADFDADGRAIGIRYTGDVTSAGTTTTATWLSFGRQYDSAQRVDADWSPSGASTQAGGYTRGYTYDRAARLIQVNDAAGTAGTGLECTTRTYGFDTRGNRTSRSTSTASDCSSSGATTVNPTYDPYSRSLAGNDGSSTYSLDGFGRQLTVPASDTPNAGQSLTLGYYDSDNLRSLTQGGIVTTYELDPDGRILSESASGSAPAQSVNHYVDGTDGAAWVTSTASGATTTARYVKDLTGMMGASSIAASSTTYSLQLSDLAGSVVATVPIPSSGHAATLAVMGLSDEFGASLHGSSGASSNPYAWAGSFQRTTTASGLMIMGKRIYNPAVGRFTTRDPVPGGNENAYTYPNDPIDLADFSGEYSYSYDYNHYLGSTGLLGTPTQAMRVFKKYFKDVFPFPITRCGSLVEGGICTLHAAYDIPHTKGNGNVKVHLTSTTLKFTVTSSHYFDAAGSVVQFHFHSAVSGRQSALYMEHIATAHGSTALAYAAWRSGAIEGVWSVFDAKLIAILATH